MQFRITSVILVIVILLLLLQCIGCIGSSSPVQQVPATITAMQGYDTAKKVAIAQYGDAIFFYVAGNPPMNPQGTAVKIDGTSPGWVYSFGSLSKKKLIRVVVFSNYTTMVYPTPENETLAPFMLLSLSGIHSDQDWKCDSDKATQTVFPVYMKLYGSEPLSATYMLSNLNDTSGKINFYWMIQLKGKANDQITVYVDAITGDLVID